MRFLSTVILSAGLLAGIGATLQKPLHEEDPVTLPRTPSSWDFNFSSPAPHYFSSVYGLLQQWPNTFFPRGYSIVPCEIPPLTNLYHGRRDSEAPPSPEWFAFDIGMAYGIMGGNRNSHMSIYQTTRRARCVYFDGESATLFGDGQMDTQMLHIYGNTSGPPRGGFGLWEEYARATGLCNWLDGAGLGGPGGFEGIVRMNAGFEMIWCNFTSPTIRLISQLNVTVPLLEHPEDDTQTDSNSLEPSYVPLPPSPTRTDIATDPTDPPFPPVTGSECLTREPFWNTQAWNWFVAGTAHYGSSGEGAGRGESRVKISHSCGFLSYYSPKFLQPSEKALNLTDDGRWLGPSNDFAGKQDRINALNSLTRRRRQHSLQSVSPKEATIMREDSERVLRSLTSSNVDGECSGIDWVLLTNEIVQTYASPLLIFKKTLYEFEELSSNKTALQQWVASIRDKSHTFLVPFLEYPADTKKEVWERGSRLYKDTHSRCRYQSTRLLAPEIGIHLSEEELSLKWAVEETTGAICSVLVETGLQIESIWQSDFNALTPTSTGQDIEPKVLSWIEGVEELMAWLGWAGEWTRCEKKCEWDEKCFIPMWPMIPVGRRPQPGCRTGYGDHPPHGPPYGRPSHDRPPYFGPPSNRTGRPPPGGGFGWGQDETNLWDPICVKSDYILHG